MGGAISRIQSLFYSVDKQQWAIASFSISKNETFCEISGAFSNFIANRMPQSLMHSEEKRTISFL